MNPRLRNGTLVLTTLVLFHVGSVAAPRFDRTRATREERSTVATPRLPGGQLGTETATLNDEVVRPFKLKGAGQVDLATGGFNFAGVATHLGRYTADGLIDLSTFSIQGSFAAADSDTVDWTAQFSIGPLGELQVTFTFTGGTGRLAGAGGSASGPVLLDPDFMFVFTLEGTISY